jgi:hypothetical protein
MGDADMDTQVVKFLRDLADEIENEDATVDKYAYEPPHVDEEIHGFRVEWFE